MGSGRINYGNLIINGGNATNRIVTGGVYTNVILGDLTINSGSEYAPAIVVVVGGNFTSQTWIKQIPSSTLVFVGDVDLCCCGGICFAADDECVKRGGFESWLSSDALTTS